MGKSADLVAGLWINRHFVQHLPGDSSYALLRDAAIEKREPVILISASGHECDLLPFTGTWVGSAG